MQPGLINMEYLHSDVPQDQLLREHGRALAQQRRDERAERRGRLSPRARAIVIARRALRHSTAS
jgi:hypothetical protein